LAKKSRKEFCRDSKRVAEGLTEEQVQAIKPLAATLTKTQMADYFGMDFGTFHEILLANPEWMLLYRQGKAEAIADIGGNLIQRARHDFRDAKFYLATQAGWVEKSAVDHTSSDGSMSAPTTINLVAKRFPKKPDGSYDQDRDTDEDDV
jgi:hypothetical protein